MRTVKNRIKTGLAVAAGVLCAAGSLRGAPPLTVLHNFSAQTNLQGSSPQTPLFAGPDGWLYGTTPGSLTGSTGTNGYGGLVFKMQPDGSQFAVLHVFGGPDGITPAGGVIGSGGTLYGVAEYGGAANGGVVYKLNTDGTGFTVLHNFAPSRIYGGYNDGTYPAGQLLLAGHTLYGATLAGGTNDTVGGTLFRIGTDGTDFALVNSFSLADGPPGGSLLASGSTLYGTTKTGGAGYGSIFAINTNGGGFTVLHSFSASYFSTNYDGVYPNPGLVLYNGRLYGTAEQGGTNGYGTVFALNTDGGGFADLHDFERTGQPVGFNPSEAQLPQAGLLVTGGKLYGTTAGNDPLDPLGDNDSGTVFSINPNGTGYTNIYVFPPAQFNFANGYTNSNGVQPLAALAVMGNTLFGTAHIGGTNSAGTAFSIHTDGTAFSILQSFSQPGIAQDGRAPIGGLILSGGILYGATTSDGVSGVGTVFSLSTNGSSFTNLCNQGAQGVMLLLSNTLFATSTGNGNIFSLNTNGSGFTNYNNVLDNPLGGLAASGNNIYGCSAGGPHYSFGGQIRYTAGNLFSLNSDGSTFTNFFQFSGTASGSGNPLARLLVQDGTIYGTTAGFSGSDGFGHVVNVPGSVFKVHTDGSQFTVLHLFNNPNDTPQSEVILSGDILYGTTPGTIYAVDTNGLNFSTLHSFQGPDGAGALGGLVISGNTLMGTTAYGGSANDGTIFAVQTDGTCFESLYSFTNGIDGSNPSGDLVLNGNSLFGTVQNGGFLANAGLVFAFDLRQAPPRLNYAWMASQIALSWSNPAFSLQSSSSLTGPFINVAGATSPCSFSVSTPQHFFRLQSN